VDRERRPQRHRLGPRAPSRHDPVNSRPSRHQLRECIEDTRVDEAGVPGSVPGGEGHFGVVMASGTMTSPYLWLDQRCYSGSHLEDVAQWEQWP
jgi:hypothetical protein